MNDKLREAIEFAREWPTFEKLITLADAAERGVEAEALNAHLQEEVAELRYSNDKMAVSLKMGSRWYTIAKNGAPTDASKHVLWQLEDGTVKVWAKGHWEPDRHLAPGRYYTYITPYEPVEEPLPKCGVCNGRAGTWKSNGGYVRCGCHLHGDAHGSTEAQAQDNWRKMRGGKVTHSGQVECPDYGEEQG